MLARDRSIPHKRSFAIALFLSAFHYLSLVALLAGGMLFLLRQDQLAAVVLAAAAGLCALTWVLAFLKRRSARCPLCKGTPYLNTGALVHRKATRIFPLNHGTSAIISSLFTLRFRCMFCGTRFDLLKAPSRHRR